MATIAVGLKKTDSENIWKNKAVLKGFAYFVDKSTRCQERKSRTRSGKGISINYGQLQNANY